MTETQKEIIEQYLKFGKENGCNDCSLEFVKEVFWNGWEYKVIYEDKKEKWSNALNSIICRISFIEAIAKGLWKNKTYFTDTYERKNYIIIGDIVNDVTEEKITIPMSFTLEDEKKEESILIKKLADILTKKQAIAIRDYKLEEFITNLLKNENNKLRTK